MDDDSCNGDMGIINFGLDVIDADCAKFYD